MDIKSILSQVDEENVATHIKWLTENAPYRIAGSGDEKRASQYIVSCLEEYGLDAENIEFNTYNSNPEYSKLELISPKKMEFESLPCAHIRSTDKDGEEFELIYVGNGSYEAYENIDPRGKVVLVEVSYAPPVPEKARIAYEKGALGIICMNWGNDEGVICNRGLKSVWGNPTEETFDKIPDIIGVGITRTEGLILKDICLSNSNVRIRLTAIATRDWSKVHQPKGILKGNGKNSEFILVGSHIDAWKPGVTCNATGNATALEICRVLSKYKNELDRDIWFVFWDGHEIAEAAGSTWLVDNCWDELNKNCIAYINIDSTGMKEATLYEIKSADELNKFSCENAKELVECGIRIANLGKIGDQSFMGIGVPGVAQRMSYTKEYMENAHGATLGWWNHTKEDGLDKYDAKNIMIDVRVTLSLIYKLAVIKVLPYEFENKFLAFEDKLNTLSKRYFDYINWSDLYQNLITAKNKVSKIQEGRANLTSFEQINLYNKFVIKVARLVTNVFQTYGSKYGQDSYGYTNLAQPIPLFADLIRMEKLSKDSIQYGMIETQLSKNKNRINDALNEVIYISELYEKIFSQEVN